MDRTNTWRWLVLVVACGSSSSSPHETLVRADNEAAGSNCAAGGVALHSGVDQNNNGVLDDTEVTDTTYVCAPAPGVVGNVSGFEAIGIGDHAVLLWTNPTGTAFAGVTIRRATGGYPASPIDGTSVYDGMATTMTDTGLTAGTEYFYRAFAHDSGGTYASGVDAAAFGLAPGSRDPSFNGGGQASFTPQEIFSRVLALAVDSNGRPAASGFEQGIAPGTGRGVLWQLDRDGALDPMFNGGTELDLHGIPSTTAGLVFDSVGRVLVSDTGPRVHRLLPDGSHDSSFGDGGIADLALGSPPAWIALDAQGRIVMVYAVGSASMQITRLTANGIKDTTFGTAGSVRVDQLPGASSPNAYATGIETSGTDVIVSGYGTNSAGNFDVAVWRFDQNGAPVTAFGTNGLVQIGNITGGVVAFAFAVRVDSMGRIVVAGSANESANYQMAMWRLTSTGVVDTTFGTAGVVVDRDAAGGTGFDSASALALDAQGRIVVAGHSANAAGGDDPVIWRFTPDGLVDTTFGNGGRVVERGEDGVGTNSEIANTVAIDPWGRILVGGSVGPNAEAEATIWRYVP